MKLLVYITLAFNPILKREIKNDNVFYISHIKKHKLRDLYERVDQILDSDCLMTIEKDPKYKKHESNFFRKIICKNKLLNENSIERLSRLQEYKVYYNSYTCSSAYLCGCRRYFFKNFNFYIETESGDKTKVSIDLKDCYDIEVGCNFIKFIMKEFDYMTNSYLNSPGKIVTITKINS